MTVLLGCIADDTTGATDLVGNALAVNAVIAAAATSFIVLAV